MSEFDYLGYEGRKRSLGSQYGASAARNAYARFLAQQRGDRARFDIGRKYEKAMPSFIAGYTRRGIAGPGVRSGIYNQGLQEFGSQQVEEQNRARQDMLEAFRQADLTEADLKAEYQTQLAELEAQKQNQIAQTAATLNSFRPFLGGY
jgi:hypothetical protein